MQQSPTSTNLRARGYFGGLTIRRNLLIATIPMFLGLLLLGAFAGYQFSQDRREQIDNQVSTEADALERQIDFSLVNVSAISDLRNISRYEASLRQYQENVEENNGVPTLDDLAILNSQLNTELLIILGSNSGALLKSAALIDLNGNVISQVDRIEGEGSASETAEVEIADLGIVTAEPYWQIASTLRNREFWVSDVILQQGDRNVPVIQVFTPLAADNERILAYWVFEVNLTDVLQIADRFESDEDSRVAFILDEDGYFLAHSENPEWRFGRTLNEGLQVTGDTAQVLINDDQSETATFEIEDQEYVGAVADFEPFTTNGTIVNQPTWFLVVAQENNIATGLIGDILPIIILEILFLMITGVVIAFQNRSLRSRFDVLNEGIRSAALGNLETRLPTLGQNELGEVGQTFNRSVDYFQQLVTELENSAQERIRDLDITAEISREVAGLRDVNLVLQRAINRIVERFDFYHAQVFLVDDVGENAVLIASTGTPGQILLSKNHKLGVGSQSVIGRVSSLGVTVIAGDTLSTDVPWRPNEDLPETRAEMALPLKFEDQVIGALDIQSKRPDAFSPRDIEVFQVLADQLSIAINNARLLSSSEERVEEIANLNARLTEQAWRDFSNRTTEDFSAAYRYDLMRITEANETIPVRSSMDDDEGVRHSTPISIRGLEVGAIETTKSDLDDEDRTLIQSVAERISLALDNARLFEETQVALSESRRLYETARSISSSAELDIDVIYQIIANQLIYQDTLDYISILIAEPIPSPRNSTLRMKYQWTREDIDLVDLTWDIEDQVMLLERGLANYFQRSPRAMLEFGNPVELAEDVDGGDALAWIQQQLEVNSLMIVPLTTGVKWFGVLICASNSMNAFDEAFQNFTIAAGDQLAIAIDNNRLLNEVQVEARRSLALAEASQLANQISGDFQAGVERLFNAVADPGNFNRWWFGLLETNTRLEKVVANAPEGMDQIPNEFDISVSHNALAMAAQLRQVVLVNNVDEEHPVLGDIPPEEAVAFGKHLAVPIEVSGDVLGVMLIGRDPQNEDLGQDDIQLANAVASQLGVATENQRLFSSIQNQQQTLQTTLETMPAGVVLIDNTGQILLTNVQAQMMLGTGVRDDFFSDDTFTIVDVDTEEPYTPQTFPLTRVLSEGQPVSDNIAVVSDDNSRINLSMGANPVKDAEGNITLVVAVFQDITELVELERALQSSLSETTILYEASRQILGATSMDALSPNLMAQMQTLNGDETYIIIESSDDFNVMPPSVVASDPVLDITDPVVSDIPLPAEMLMPDDVLVIDDTTNVNINQIDQDVALAANQAGVASFASVPLKARGQSLGWLVIAFKERHNFSSEERRFMTSLADQAAVALDGIRLFEGTERALQSVASLYQSSRRVAEAQGIIDVINITREELLNFQPDRIDMLLQVSAEDVDNMYFAIDWANETSLETIPALPVHPETAQPLEGFDLFSRDEFFIENFLNDVGSNELHEAMYRLDTPYQAVISVPLRVGGRTIGRLAMGFLNPRYFSSDERQLISTLADSTAYVVENDMLLEQTQESLEETGVLYQASQTIANAETREEIVQALIDNAASAHVDKTMLISLMTRTWDEPGAVIEISSTWGSEEVSSLTGLFFTKDQFPIWEQLSSPHITWFDDVETSEDISDFAKMGYQALGIESATIVPLGTPNGIIGCILFGSSIPRRHEAREVRIYQALADQAAVQLENKRLFEQAEFRARQLATSAEVSRAVTSILDLEQLFPRVVDLIVDSFDYDHVQIFMVDPRDNKAYVRASTGEAGRQLMAISHNLAVGSDSVIGRVTSKGEPVIALDTTDPEVVHRPNPYLPETRSEMALPLFVEGNVVGALDVQSNRPQAFDNDDIQALTPLVDQLSVAIQNANLFNTAQQRADEMRFLFDVTTAAAGETQLEESLRTIVEMIIRKIGSNTTNIFLYDAENHQLKSQIITYYDSETGRYTVDDAERTIVHELGSGLSGWVAENRIAQIVPDLTQDDRYSARFQGMKSGLYVPLISAGELIGVMALESDETHFFDADDLQLLQAMSTSISAVVRNAQLLEEVREQFIRLQEVDELKTNFLAAMSHELRTPLNSIIGFSRVILKGIDGPLTDMQEQDIQTIHDSGKHLLGLVNNILDQAKIEAGKMELVIDYFDVKGVIETVMATAMALRKNDDVRLFTEVPADIPQAFGDEFRTRQILLNLVSNAAKFTEQGYIKAYTEIAKGGAGEPDYIHIGIEDTGKGIAEDDFRHLFEAFQQVDNSTTREVEGTGLGLPLSRSFATLQNGDLWFESEYGQGSTFYVSIPLGPAPEVPEEDEDEDDTDEDTELAESGDVIDGANGHASTELSDALHVDEDMPEDRRILAVDDDEEVIDLYRRYLTREGWYVIGTTEPENVEELATTYHPEIILLDVNMPNRTGWQVLEGLRAKSETTGIPVIICSIDDNKERSEELGAQRHLVKPFMEADLVKAVKSLEPEED